MREEASELLKRARALSPPERAELARALIESLDETERESFQEAWDAEIFRRMKELNSGKVKTVSLDEARRRLFASLD